MQLFPKILCPIDFSEYSTLALRYAVALTRENNADLVVYHSVPDLSQAVAYLEGNYIETVNEMLTSNAGKRLDEFISDIVPNHSVRMTKLIGTGDPSEAILQTAKNQAVDLIVMGTHGYTGPERFFLGSVTNKVLHKSIVPVLVVCKTSHHFIKQEGERAVEIKRVLCAADLEPNNSKIRDLALSIARSYQSKVFFLYVAQRAEGIDWSIQQELAFKKLKDLINPELEKECSIEFLVASGDPAQEILSSIQQYSIDLVVMGHHTRRPIEEVILGSVAKRVVVDSCCPVLVVRSRSELIYP